jgi:peptidoglycan/xylan/chitin deacetylase (PgdA/CDA1 family)
MNNRESLDHGMGRWMAAFLLAGLLLCSCVKTPSSYTTRDFIVVETTVNDTLESLARTYLHDSKKGWMISEFNKIKEVKQGQRIIIPLKPFNRGGLSPEGFQMVPVLCFEVAELSPANAGKDGKYPAMDSFKAHLAYLKRYGYQVISMADFMDFLDYKGQIPEKSVVITVDDQSYALLDWVLPTLTAYGYPATVFVDERAMDKGNTVSFDDLRPYLSHGISLGSRSGWDIDSAIEQKQNSLKDYFENMERAVGRSKSIIEKETGRKCLFYAYPPSGSYNLIVNLLRKTGFKAGFTLNGEPNPFYGDSYAVHRIDVPLACSDEEFERKLVVFKKMELR